MYTFLITYFFKKENAIIWIVQENLTFEEKKRGCD